MQVLLVSDTHGDLDCINALVSRTGAEAVIHASDFGFYDEGSPDRLATRQLALTARHSDLQDSVRDQAFALRRERLLGLVKSRSLLSDLPDAKDGHAVLVEEDGVVSLETFSKGRRFETRPTP